MFCPTHHISPCLPPPLASRRFSSPKTKSRTPVLTQRQTIETQRQHSRPASLFPLCDYALIAGLRLNLVASQLITPTPIPRPTQMSTPMASPTSLKRVRFSPDVKDSDDMSSSSRSASPIVHPKTPRRQPMWDAAMFPPSPPMSDSSLGKHPHRSQSTGHSPCHPASDIEVYLHGLLLSRPSGAPALVFDVRGDASQAFIPTFPAPTSIASQLTTIASKPALRRIQLLSPLLPWVITVENPNGVTVGDVLSRIQESLNRTAAKSEFDQVPQRDQATVLRAYQRNCTLGNRKREDGLKRIDWLGRKTLFAGIRKDERDELLIASRVKDAYSRSETFVLEFTSPA